MTIHFLPTVSRMRCRSGYGSRRDPAGCSMRMLRDSPSTMQRTASWYQVVPAVPTSNFTLTRISPGDHSNQLHMLRYIILLTLFLLPASCLLSQGIVPHRDIQAVDSLNRGKPAVAPITV